MEIKQITEALNYDPSNSSNDKVQAEFKKAAELHQKHIDDWTKREQELTKLNEKLKPVDRQRELANTPAAKQLGVGAENKADQYRRHELKLEQGVAANDYKAANFDSASKIANHLGSTELAKSLSEKSKEASKQGEAVKSELNNFRESLKTQEKLEKVENNAPSWKTMVSAHEQSLQQSMEQTPERQKAQQEFVRQQQDKRGLTNADLIPGQQQAVVAEQNKPAKTSIEAPAVPAPVAQNNPAQTPEFRQEMQESKQQLTSNRFQMYQDGGEIAGDSSPSMSGNYASSLSNNAMKRHETYQDRAEKLAADIETERCKPAGEYNQTKVDRMLMLQELEHAHYESQTSHAASNICAFNGDKETATKMSQQADKYDAKRDEMTEKLYAFDKKHGLLPEQKEASLKISGQDQPAQKPSQKEAAQAKTDPKPQHQGANKMIKSSELSAPKNAAAARHVEKVKGDEAKKSERSIDPKTQAIFARSEERRASQAEKASQSQRETAKHKPVSM